MPGQNAASHESHLGEVQASLPRGALLQMGSQSEQALARVFEDVGVDMIVLPGDTRIEQLQDFDVVVRSGSASSVYDEDAPKTDPRILGKDFAPLLINICFSAQEMVHLSGGHVVPSHEGDGGSYGDLDVTVIDQRPEGGFPKIQQGKFIHSNGDHFVKEGLPPTFVATAMTGDHVAAFVDTETNNVGLQFHPELSGPLGFGIVRDILRHRGLRLEPKPINQFERIVEEINEKAGEDDLVVGFSGGIDSNVVAEAVLASKVPRDKIHIVHFDLGVNRTENGIPESTALLDRFEARTGIRPDLVKLDLHRVLYEPVTLINEDNEPEGDYILSKAIDSELKRKIFAQLYANAFTDYIQGLNLDIDHTKIVQGTLYPDVIESIGKGKVKSHHNQSPIMIYWEKTGRTIAPLARLFKNDGRQIGREQGFEEIDSERQPFPGPGFIPRIVCSDGVPILPWNPLEIWERAKEKVGDEFGVVLGGFRTVGQKGDKRSYAWPIILSGPSDWEYMAHLTVELGNAFPETINRVYYITGEPVDGVPTWRDMTWTRINEESLNQLRPIDDKATQLLRYCGALGTTDQVPIGLLPTPFQQSGGERTAFFRPIRTPKTNSFLVAEAVRPDQDPAIATWYAEATKIALQQPGIAKAAYDLTGKPPGSIEGE